MQTILYSRLKLCINAKKVVIFGTGNFGKIVLHGLKNHKVLVQAFVDLNPTNVGSTISGIPVIKLSDVPKESHLILASNRNNINFLKDLAFKENIRSVDNCDFLFKDYNFSELSTSWSMQKCKDEINRFLFLTELKESQMNVTSASDDLSIRSLDIVLTEKCSLKCVDCSNLMQYYQKPENTNHDSLKVNLRKFLDNVNHVDELRLIGGEPFMYKRIYEILELILKYKNFKAVVIYTNGTIIPKPNFLDLCTDPRVEFFISNYGAQLSKKANALEEKLRPYKIKYTNEIVTDWQNCGIIGKVDRTEDEHFSVYSNCCVKDTLTLLHGKIFGCPYAAHIHNLKACPNFEGDYFDISEIQQKKIKLCIAKLVNGERYFGACTFCNGRDYTVGSVPAAVQTHKPLNFLKF